MERARGWLDPRARSSKTRATNARRYCLERRVEEVGRGATRPSSRRSPSASRSLVHRADLGRRRRLDYTLAVDCPTDPGPWSRGGPVRCPLHGVGRCEGPWARGVAALVAPRLLSAVVASSRRLSAPATTAVVAGATVTLRF